MLRSSECLPITEVGTWIWSGQVHRLCFSGGDPREWSMMPVPNGVDWVILFPVLKPQDLLERSSDRTLLLARLKAYCDSHPVSLYDKTAWTLLACISQPSYLWEWDMQGFTWRDDWSQESWTQHSLVKRDMDPSPDCPSDCAQVSRPMELLDLVQMWTGLDIACLQFGLVRNKDLLFLTLC